MSEQSGEFGGVLLGRPMCVVTNDHYWRGGSICSACGARLRCGCGRFTRENDLDRHTLSGECPLMPGPAPCWPGECDATCSLCESADLASSEVQP